LTALTVLDLAGAKLVESYITTPGSGPPRRAADVIFLEKEETGAEVLSTQDNDEKDHICRQAISLGIPVRDRIWLVSVGHHDRFNLLLFN
jgi:hypothetical protein